MVTKSTIPESIRRLIGRIDHYRLRMSYNESYFGEPPGLLKGVLSELAALTDPIYPNDNNDQSRNSPLMSIEDRYSDLLKRLGVNGHDGAVTEIKNLRKSTGLD